MDTHAILLSTMVKCAIRHNNKDINEWGDQKTYSAMAKDIATQLAMDGISLERNNTSSGDSTKSVLTNQEGQ